MSNYPSPCGTCSVKRRTRYFYRLKQINAYARKHGIRPTLPEQKKPWINPCNHCSIREECHEICKAQADYWDESPYSAEKFHLAHIDHVNGICRLTVEDSKDDPDIVYAKADVDRRLLQIVGKDNFIPWDERIGGKINEGNA